MNFERATIYTVAEYGTVEQLKQKAGTAGVVDFFNEKKENLLHCAIRGRNKGVFDYLIKQGKVFDTPNKNGETPLHYLTQLSEKEFIIPCAKAMLNCGFDINARDKWGNNPFFTAVINCNYEDYDFIKLLVSYKPDVTTDNKAGSSAFKIAEEDENETLLRIFSTLKK